MNGAELLQPVFRFLDRMIYVHGDVLYMVLVYVSIPLIVWILSGGMRRKQSRKPNHTYTCIILIWPLVRPPAMPPPIIGDEPERGRWDCEPPEGSCRPFDN